MLARRLRAFELYSGGIKPIEIGRQLGVTRQTVSYWSRSDKWDVRLSEVVHRAEEALIHVLGDQIAHILKSLRARMGQRVAELEGLCASRNEHVRLKAINAWLKLAGVDQAIAAPTDPTSPRSLELIEDLGGGAVIEKALDRFTGMLGSTPAPDNRVGAGPEDCVPVGGASGHPTVGDHDLDSGSADPRSDRS